MPFCHTTNSIKALSAKFTENPDDNNNNNTNNNNNNNNYNNNNNSNMLQMQLQKLSHTYCKALYFCCILIFTILECRHFAAS